MGWGLDKKKISFAFPQKLRFGNSVNKKTRKRGFFIIYERGLAALILIAQRFENQQKKHQQYPK